MLVFNKCKIAKPTNSADLSGTQMQVGVCDSLGIHAATPIPSHRPTAARAPVTTLLFLSFLQVEG